jgi:dUTP pyrophosphatase
MVPLYNMSDTDVEIKAFERVAQGIFQTFLKTDDDTPLNQSREGGFGSSSK